MEWKNLSEEAKGVIEWVVSPITNFKKTIKIKIGETFHRRCPKFCVDYRNTIDSIDIPITKELFQEILEYVSRQEDMEYKKSSDSLIFRLKNDVEV